MSHEGPRDAGTDDRPLPSNQRRVFLEGLHYSINHNKTGIKAIFAMRAGCSVLFVLNKYDIAHTADIGCDFDRAEGWAFTWAADGSRIGRADDPDGAADTLERALRAQPGEVGSRTSHWAR
ncbi:hypothetical protein F8568_039540 [Actinomadura sp. LD22]|uniref:Uncharacterized protein n=1 Tax=Actinomadura physcomitrii TaxID=2650748 RepID=A0A6I4MVI3_9ACTN|nr:hypothetical protein [Actinomadura physcomitrii]MWA06336.1 hypothetical protein [Actinomadura physcomitrii]